MSPFPASETSSPSAPAVPAAIAEVSSVAAAEASPKKRRITRKGKEYKRRARPADPDYMKGAKDQVETHPLRDEIDKAILTKSLKAEEICKKYGFSGTWVVYRRKAVHKRRLKALKRKMVRTNHYNREKNAENRTLGLVNWALDASKQGYEKIMLVADNPQDIERGATFLDRYMASVKIFGNATGELTEGGGGPQVNVDNRQMYVMSLPRNSDSPEIIESEQLRVRQVSGGSPAAQITGEREVIDLDPAEGDDDSDLDDDSDFSESDLALLQAQP